MRLCTRILCLQSRRWTSVFSLEKRLQTYIICDHANRNFHSFSMPFTFNSPKVVCDVSWISRTLRCIKRSHDVELCLKRIHRGLCSSQSSEKSAFFYPTITSLDVNKILGNVERPEFVEQLFEGLTNKERASLARSITLVESSNRQRQREAQLLLTKVLDYNKSSAKHQLKGPKSFRIGLSGPPGAGKSTFIETFGKFLTSQKYRVAVLAVDPSSSTTGGSLLGDKTRMPQLSCDENAYIRPSPSCGTLGGVTRTTNEAIVLCEGAGYDVIIVETVGVGQSEFAVADMVDLFCLLIPPAGGDELQGIKKGIVEVADYVVVNKSDGDLANAARRIQTEYTSALKFMRPRSKVWRPKVTRISSIEKTGILELWEGMQKFYDVKVQSGELLEQRERQLKLWFSGHIRDHIMGRFQSHPRMKVLLPKMEELVVAEVVTPGLAADYMLEQFLKSLD